MTNRKLQHSPANGHTFKSQTAMLKMLSSRLYKIDVIVPYEELPLYVCKTLNSKDIDDIFNGKNKE